MGNAGKGAILSRERMLPFFAQVRRGMPPAGGGGKGAILFRKREWPVWDPKRKAFDWQFRARMTFVPPEWKCLRAALPRWVLLYDLMCSYHPLPLCQSRSGAAESPSTGALLNAASEAMPLFRTQSAAKQSSLAPHDSKARLIVVTIRRDSWRSHVHRTYIAQRVQFFKLQSRNVGGRGGLPSHFSWGSKGGILFGKRIPPLTAHSHANGRPPRALWARYLRRYHVPAHRQQCHAARKAHHRRL